MTELERRDAVMDTPRPMLTGDQIAAARKLAGIKTRDELAAKANVGVATVARAEAARAQVPGMNTEPLSKIIQALEAAGVEFFTREGGSLVGDVGMRLRSTKGGQS